MSNGIRKPVQTVASAGFNTVGLQAIETSGPTASALTSLPSTPQPTLSGFDKFKINTSYNFNQMTPKMQAQTAGGIAGGVAGIVGGIVGGRARRQEQKAAKAELAQRQREYEGFEFKDPSAGMTNPFEDLTVNQQQAQFEAQQSQQGLASTLSGLQGAAGGSGIAALAQAMAGQQQQNIQRASASIGQQEQANQMARAQGQQNLEAQRSAGQQYVQQQEFGRTSTLLEAAAGRKMAADQARAQATQSIVGGVGELVGAGASLAMPGL